jgi:hypothetical protein
MSLSLQRVAVAQADTPLPRMTRRAIPCSRNPL